MYFGLPSPGKRKQREVATLSGVGITAVVIWGSLVDAVDFEEKSIGLDEWLSMRTMCNDTEVLSFTIIIVLFHTNYQEIYSQTPYNIQEYP